MPDSSQHNNNPVEAMQSVMNDPQVVEQIQEQLLRYQPIIERLDQELAKGDPIASGCLREIACYLCDLIAHLEGEYDPALGSLLLQYLGSMMATSPEKWATYTREIAPQCNANKLRTQRARGTG